MILRTIRFCKTALWSPVAFLDYLESLTTLEAYIEGETQLNQPRVSLLEVSDDEPLPRVHEAEPDKEAAAKKSKRNLYQKLQRKKPPVQLMLKDMQR